VPFVAAPQEAEQVQTRQKVRNDLVLQVDQSSCLRLAQRKSYQGRLHVNGHRAATQHPEAGCRLGLNQLVVKGYFPPPLPAVDPEVPVGS
jgi:hypothetical protein